MKTKSAIKDMFCGISKPHRQVKFTKNEKELFDKICRFDFLIRKSLVYIPSIFELYETISELTEILNIERANNYYAEGFKSGFSIGTKITENNQTFRKFLQEILGDFL